MIYAAPRCPGRGPALPRATLAPGHHPPRYTHPRDGPFVRQRPIWGQHGHDHHGVTQPGKQGAGGLRLRSSSRHEGQGGPAQQDTGLPWITPWGSVGKGTGVRRNSHGGSRRMASSSARGYGYGHRQLRAWWVPRVATGLVKCWRCGVAIRADELWHLGHGDGNRHVHKGPEHVDCNCRTNARDRHMSDPLPRVDKWWEDT